MGQRWTLLVARELLLRGPLPAAAIARGLPDVPMAQLVQRLAELEANGLVALDSETRAYEMTEAGRRLTPVLEALARFGLERLPAPRREDEEVLPHTLMRQLELRYDGRAGWSGRFELVLEDPETLWSVEPPGPAPARWALTARAGELRVRPGACLEPDAVLRLSVQTATRLVAGDPQAAGEVALEGDGTAARALLERLGGAPVAATRAA